MIYKAANISADFINPLVLNLSMDERSWFDKLTTNGVCLMIKIGNYL
jgi:hypothetical protein